jgi:hypothetical protein
LRIGGATRADIFTPEAMDAVHFYSQGIPRVVNLLCEHALINAYVEHSERVGARMVEDAAREFLLDERRPVVVRRNVPELSNDHLAVIHTIFSDGLGSQLAEQEEKAAVAAPVMQSAIVDAGMVEFSALQKKGEPVILLDVANKTSKEGGLSEMLPLLAASAKQKTQSTIASGSLNAAPVCAQSLPAIPKAAAVAAGAIGGGAGVEANRRSATPEPRYSGTAMGIGTEKAGAARAVPIVSAEKPTVIEGASTGAVQPAQAAGIKVQVRGRVEKTPSRRAQWLRSPMRANLPGISHTTLFKLMSTVLLMRSVLRAWGAEFRRDWQAMIRATPLPRMKQVFMHWLCQPIRSEVWQATKAPPMPARRNVVPQKT